MIISTKIRLYIAGVFLSLSAASAVGQGQESNDMMVIATVNNLPISLNEISVRSEISGERILAREEEKLNTRIREIIKDRAISELGIDVTEDEVRRSVDSKFNQAGVTDQVAGRISDIYETLFSALKKWHQNKTNGDDIYKNLLASKMTQAEWHTWQESCPDSETLVKLESLVPRSLQDMKDNSILSARRDLIYDKLLTHITCGVCVGEDEILTIYNDRYINQTNKPEFSEVKKQIESELVERKRLKAIEYWWQTRILEATIVINDERLKAAWDARNRQSLQSNENNKALQE